MRLQRDDESHRQKYEENDDEPSQGNRGFEAEVVFARERLHGNLLLLSYHAAGERHTNSISLLHMKNLVLLFAFIVSAQRCFTQDRPVIDGTFDDWIPHRSLHTDKTHDGGASRIDFTAIKVTNDEEYLYLYFETGKEINLQEKNSIMLHIDTDANGNTGMRYGGIGTELTWSFGEKKGIVHTPTFSGAISHAQISLIPAPTVSSDRFEIAISRKAVIEGTPLFSHERIRLLLADGLFGDQLPDGDSFVEYVFTQERYPHVEPIPISRVPGTVRLLSWNVKFDAPFHESRRSSFTRILTTINPDILCFQEFFNRSATEVLEYVESVLPAPAGRRWKAFKLDKGNVFVTYYDVEGAWQVLADARLAAFHVRIDEPFRSSLLVFNNHLRCCTKNKDRQREVDALIAFVRKAKSGEGLAYVEPETPIMMVGDFNLVGYKRQLETLITGDIRDNDTFGPDAAPDWDGRAFTDLKPRRIRSLFPHTWFDPTGSFAAGRLDFVFYSKSAMDVHRSFIFHSGDLTPAERMETNVQAFDSDSASDHSPIVVDFSPKKKTHKSDVKGSLIAPSRSEKFAGEADDGSTRNRTNAFRMNANATLRSRILR